MMKQKDLAIKIKMSETKQPLQKKINEQDHKKLSRKSGHQQK